jgi:hypothetical protein
MSIINRPRPAPEVPERASLPAGISASIVATIALLAACAAPPPDAVTPATQTTLDKRNEDKKPADKPVDDNQPVDDKKPIDEEPVDKEPVDKEPVVEEPKPADKTPSDVDPQPTVACMTTEDIYVKRVWAPFLSTTCNKCHQPIGMAKDTKFVLAPPTENGHVQKNLKMLADVAKFEVNGTSVLLLKPTGQIDHAGGTVLDKDGEEYKALAMLIDRLKNPVKCVKPPTSAFFSGVSVLGHQGTLRKAALNIAGRLPNNTEKDLVAAGGLAGLSKALDLLLTTDAFIDRVKELYAETFLQGRYDKYNNALNLIDSAKYSGLNWYEMAKYNAPKLYGVLRDGVNKGIARQATELVGHVVKNNLPFSQVLTADYTMLNAYAARSYGLTAVGYKDGQDPADVSAEKFFPVKLPMQPHAGVLTTPAWLARFPTTDTNRNRHRSLKVYAQWLATDVLAEEDRPTDVTSISGFNPTMYNTQCAICHSIVDPIAGTFQNWDTAGRYKPPPKGWHQDMRPPGFAEATMPFASSHQALRWLTKTVTQDPRFAQSAVETSYTLLTGRKALRMPTDTEAADFGHKMAAYDAQHHEFASIAASFNAQNQNFKVAIKGVALSKWFRAHNLSPTNNTVAPTDKGRMQELRQVGTAELLTPEQLDRKIRSLTNHTWKKGNTNLLTSMSGYALLYGGVDGDLVEARLKVPSGIMTSLAERMANEMACHVVPREMRMAPGTRKLLPIVEEKTTPETEKGVDANAQALIKANIQHLHAHLLGESLDADAKELQVTYELWEATWEEASLDPTGTLPKACHVTKDVKTGANLPATAKLTSDKHGTVRAWMAVVAYMLADYKFTHQ